MFANPTTYCSSFCLYSLSGPFQLASFCCCCNDNFRPAWGGIDQSTDYWTWVISQYCGVLCSSRGTESFTTGEGTYRASLTDGPDKCRVWDTRVDQLVQPPCSSVSNPFVRPGTRTHAVEYVCPIWTSNSTWLLELHTVGLEPDYPLNTNYGNVWGGVRQRQTQICFLFQFIYL